MMATSKTDVFSIAYIKKILQYQHLNIAQEFLKCMQNDNNKKKFSEIIKSMLRPKDLIVVLSLFTKIHWSVFDSAKIDILSLLISNEFYDSIFRFLRHCFEMNCFEKDDFFILVRFYEIFMMFIPICEDTYEKFLSLFEISCKCLERINLASPKEMILPERMGEIFKLLLFKAYYIERNFWHYSFVNMYPSPVDFFENRNLSPNITNGPYESTDHYLDVHFKILKEDFVCSVRESIDNYKAKGIKNSLHLYKNVCSRGISIDHNNLRSKIYHNIVFTEEDRKMLEDENFQITKKFMTGSLVFFSRNDFTTFIVATVEDNGDRIKNPDKKFTGIKVSVIGNPYQLMVHQYYDMIEPITFFEPYYQSLKTLQTMNPNNFPLAKNIVFVDMRPVSSGRKLICNQNYNLNPSQMTALEAAITQKFSIIQGPPGTGKSYLARAIISTMISSNNPTNYPILVVCVRNNALDLVLEPLVSSGIKVVRLGSQSKSDILTELTLQKLRKEWFVSCSSKHLLITKIKQLRSIILDKGHVNCPEAIEEAVQSYSSALESLSCLLQYYDARQIVSSGVKVIGATTAGAARYHKLLSFLRPRMVIIEEAAEVMESFIVTSIPEACEHVVLIGDHLQLQPNPACHASVDKYKLNVSLFERMIRNGMECHQLKAQHRMRPEIASLISPLIYKELLNHPSVFKYPNVRGMAKNLFFMNHNIKEDETLDDSDSHWNFFEAEFLLALASYLVKQDYSPSEITILATYSDQHQYLKKLEAQKYQELEGIQIQVVDNYQGEENTIVLLSLVRSLTSTVGFLSKMNRINVALSRAKHGLYVVGNMNTFSTCCSGWKKIIEILKSQNAIGDSLPLQCELHKTITHVSNPNQLLQLKFGGCHFQCGCKLNCGHLCTYPCHGSRKIHDNCKQKCLRYKGCGHRCLEKCMVDCESVPCRVIQNFKLSCGHAADFECSSNFVSYKCNEPCQKLLPCGVHRCQFPCYKECGPLPCREILPIELPCKHKTSLQCNAIRSLSTYLCVEPCNRMSSCGIHKCQKKCFHKCGLCKETVIKTLECGHKEPTYCSYNEDDPHTWDFSLGGKVSCKAMVEVKSDYCKHTYLQPCSEITAGIKYTGKCIEGCSQESICSIF